MQPDFIHAKSTSQNKIELVHFELAKYYLFKTPVSLILYHNLHNENAYERLTITTVILLSQS